MHPAVPLEASCVVGSVFVLQKRIEGSGRTEGEINMLFFSIISILFFRAPCVPPCWRIEGPGLTGGVKNLSGDFNDLCYNNYYLFYKMSIMCHK